VTPSGLGCDVGQMSEREAGIMDENTTSTTLTLGERLEELTKAQAAWIWLKAY